PAAVLVSGIFVKLPRARLGSKTPETATCKTCSSGGHVLLYHWFSPTNRATSQGAGTPRRKELRAWCAMTKKRREFHLPRGWHSPCQSSPQLRLASGGLIDWGSGTNGVD